MVTGPKQIHAFKTDADPIFITKYGNGHINDTYLIVDGTARQYILQKINKNIFRATHELMENIKAVTDHLRKHVMQSRKALSLIPTKDGKDWLVDEDGEYWRLYPFISDTVCLQLVENPEDFKESGVAFGNFQRTMADFDAGSLFETIPRFHDTPNRYTNFKNALRADPLGRAKDVKREIDFALAREEYAGTLMKLYESGDMPLRVTHNDTKLNNVLFDRETRKALCVIDLDTVMPGLAVNDFGCSVRFGASTAAEDETDLTKVSFSLPLMEAFTEGFLNTCGESLTDCELYHLRDGAKMMTLEDGLRFLTDYIEGDVYYRIKRENHNIDRCRTQFKLVGEMETKWDQMQEIILKAVK
ncbi:MAG: aminoglycoside phosphotransferase family protein [Defluviitaleaceae bacterium]|nr:aminoglycoside phosphotransferase family protein [Defluviitaleaceae bacterium]